MARQDDDDRRANLRHKAAGGSEACHFDAQHPQDLVAVRQQAQHDADAPQHEDPNRHSRLGAHGRVQPPAAHPAVQPWSVRKRKKAAMVQGGHPSERQGGGTLAVAANRAGAAYTE